MKIPSHLTLQVNSLFILTTP